MKSFFSTLALVLSLVLIPANSFAQPAPPAPISCSEVDSQESYDVCCSNENYGTNREACDLFHPIVQNPQTYSFNNNYGQCLTYSLVNGQYKLIKTDIHPCGWAGTGPVTQCSDGITENNHDECCTGTNLDIYSIECANYQPGGTIGGVNPNTNPQGGAVTPGSITPTPQASSDQLKSCNAIAFNSILDILIWLKCIIAAAIIPLIFTLAFLFFLWGMTMYIRGSDDVKKREESKKFIYWGIIALTVMISVWGIIKIINTTLGFGNTVPALQTDYLKTPTKP